MNKPQSMDDPHEVLDLVDENDRPIGTIPRSEVLVIEETRQGFVRAVGCFVINSKHEVWTPRRRDTKKIAPNGLDFSAGEHVGAGEDYRDAAIRGMHEELGVTANPAFLQEIGTVPPFKGMPYFHKVFIYPDDKEPILNESDYKSSEWISIPELQRRLAEGEPAKEILPLAVELLLDITQHKDGET